MAWLFASFGEVVSEGETLEIRESDGIPRLAPSSNHDHHRDLSRWDFGSELQRILLLPSREKGESCTDHNNGNGFGQACVRVVRGGYVRTSGAQQVIGCRCIIWSRWECRFDFDHVIRLDHLIAVGRGLLLWVATCRSPGICSATTRPIKSKFFYTLANVDQLTTSLPSISRAPDPHGRRAGPISALKQKARV